MECKIIIKIIKYGYFFKTYNLGISIQKNMFWIRCYRVKFTGISFLHNPFKLKRLTNHPAEFSKSQKYDPPNVVLTLVLVAVFLYSVRCIFN